MMNYDYIHYSGVEYAEVARTTPGEIYEELTSPATTASPDGSDIYQALNIMEENDTEQPERKPVGKPLCRTTHFIIAILLVVLVVISVSSGVYIGITMANLQTSPRAPSSK